MRSSGGATAWVSHRLERGRYLVVSLYRDAAGRTDLARGLVGTTQVV